MIHFSSIRVVVNILFSIYLLILMYSLSIFTLCRAERGALWAVRAVPVPSFRPAAQRRTHLRGALQVRVTFGALYVYSMYLLKYIYSFGFYQTVGTNFHLFVDYNNNQITYYCF